MSPFFTLKQGLLLLLLGGGTVLSKGLIFIAIFIAIAIALSLLKPGFFSYFCKNEYDSK